MRRSTYGVPIAAETPLRRVSLLNDARHAGRDFGHCVEQFRPRVVGEFVQCVHFAVDRACEVGSPLFTVASSRTPSSRAAFASPSINWADGNWPLIPASWSALTQL